MKNSKRIEFDTVLMDVKQTNINKTLGIDKDAFVTNKMMLDLSTVENYRVESNDPNSDEIDGSATLVFTKSGGMYLLDYPYSKFKKLMEDE